MRLAITQRRSRTVSPALLLCVVLAQGAWAADTPDAVVAKTQDSVDPGSQPAADLPDDPQDAAAEQGALQDAQPVAEPASEPLEPRPMPEQPAPPPASRLKPTPTAKPLAGPIVGKGAAPGAMPIVASSFKGVQPGQSTREDVVRLWGAPQAIRRVEGAVERTYEIEPYSRVVVSLVDAKVSAIVLHLKQPLNPEVLAKQLQIGAAEPVTVLDALGQPLGQAYPERGVLFAFVPAVSPPRVAQVVLEGLDAQSFVLRAEHTWQQRYISALADLDAAIKLDPQNARAHSLRAELLSAIGDYELAFKHAQEAVALEAAEPEHSLVLAKVSAEMSDFGRAGQLNQEVAVTVEIPTVMKARAECQWGDCLAAGPERDYQQAVKHHMQAIKLAEPLATDSQTAVRRAAKRVLLEAHLGVAFDVASGRWQDKSKVVSKWLDRASALAEDQIAREQAPEELRLQVAHRALASLVGIQDPPDPSAWIETTLQVGRRRIELAPDPARKRTLEWQLGLALSDAAQIQTARARHEQAIGFAELSADYLRLGAKAGEQLPGHDFLIGRLYYRLGAIFALSRHDHRRAATWYDKAVPLLESPVPPSALTDPGRHGESFVSMAVSYWEIRKSQEALRLTKQGLKLMEQAVDQQLLDRTALAVPYGNLSSMLQELGQEKEAKQFATLAANCEQTQRQ